MAFLQISRRQALVEGVTNTLQRLVTGRRFYSSCTLHCAVQNQPVCPAKCTFSFLRPRLSNQPPAFLFTTQAFLLQQKAVESVVKDESSAEGGKSALGNKTNSKTKQSKKKAKKNKKTGEAVKDTNSNEVDNTESKKQDSEGSKKKKKKKSKSKANDKNKHEKNTTKTGESIKDTNAIKDQENVIHNIETKQSSTLKYAATDGKIQTERLNTDTKGRNTLKDHSGQQDLFSKVTVTLQAIESLEIDEAHPLHFCPDAVLIEAEEDLQENSKFKDAHVINSIDVEVESVEDLTLQSKTGTHIQSEPEQHFKDRSFKDGTPGGRWFKEETLAEIDAYLYLGKPNEAERLFNKYLRKGKQFEVSAFNKLLHGWAQKGNLMSVKLVFNLLKNEGLEPDMGTYAALLHAYGKYNDVNGVQNVIDEMKEKQFDINHIFHKCCLTETQAKGVANALKLVYPHYKPRITNESQSEISYPSLLKEWYTNRENVDIKLKSVPGRLEREFDESRLLELFEEQISRELSGFTPIQSIEDSKEEDTENKRLKEMFLECRSKWKEALIKSFEKDMFKTKNAQGDTLHPKYASLFQIFEHDELADIMLDTIVFYVKGRIEGVPLYGISGELGSVLNLKYIVKHRVRSGMLDKMKAIYQDYFSYLMDEKVMATKMAREVWNELDDMLPLGASLQQDVPNWPWATKVVFGCLLVECFLKSAHINVNLFNDGPEKILPAFYHTYEFNNDKRFGILKPHPIVCKLFKGYLAKQGEISMETTSVPMLVPPRPWRATKDGAYLILPVELIRSAGDEDGQYDKLLESKTNKEDLVAIFDSLNFLGGCAWKTNKRILDIAVHMFNNGGYEDLAIPGPVVQPEVDSISLKSADAEEKSKLIRERRLAKKLAREQYSLRMSALYKLSVANHFRDDVFWLPINLDFRGRVYPIPPHCAHIGDDLNRGMLQFAKGVPLGEKGLDWLKIHLVTLHGAKKKSSLQERLNYADEIMDDIMDSADNPLTGRGWWKTADDPWQTLATSMEIADAIRSPDPTQFVCHQPVHQDGSCNGLQHYAALGHDSYGAKQVNLMPADRPQDVYEEVAKLVEAARVRDAATGHEIAKELEGKVTRKVVKQTVMTIVYGVTFIGGRLQIERQLKDLGVEGNVLFKGSYYLVNKVFASIGEMFTAARGIQNWFASSATQIALSGHYVDWYTPLGLYARQPYCRKPVRHVIRTNLQWLLLKATGLPDIPPDTRKQRGAFPPNFVHSLDSTHMMLTALYCQRSGSTFASVHDSFWTHAANVGVMNRICREQFVALHSEPILEELQKHFHDNYSGLKLNRPLKSKETGEERTYVSFEGRPEHGNGFLTSVCSLIDHLQDPVTWYGINYTGTQMTQWDFQNKGKSGWTGDFDIKEVLNSTYFFC